MPKKLKVPKTMASITMTPEAWAILHERAKKAGLSKSEYIENLVRRGDLDVYDIIREFLVNLLQDTSDDVVLNQQLLENLQDKEQRLRDVLKRIGVSPNQIPD